MWKNLLSNGLIVVSVLLVTINLLNWLLSASQKSALESKAYSVWLWLSDQRKVSPIYYLQRLYGLIFLSLPLAISLMAFFVFPWALGIRITIAVLVFLGNLFLLTNISHNQILEKKFLAANSLRQAIAEALNGILRVFPITFLLILFGLLISAEPQIAMIGKPIVRAGVSLVIVPVWMLAGSISAAALLQCARIGFSLTEFVIRRALEQGKGFITATAALLSAIALFIKSIS